MLKKSLKLLIITVACAMMLSGCIARQNLRPQENINEVWVCEELENTYFYWDEEKQVLWGALSYKENVYDFVLGDSSGLVVDFYTPEVLQDNVISYDDSSLLRGVADYQKNKMPIEITDDIAGIFNGEITTLTFVPQDRQNYFNVKNE